MSAKPKILPLSREDWLEARKAGVGGSDIGAICGLSPYKGALEVWLEKTGQAAPKDESFAMWLGKELEPVIAKRYTLETGRKVILNESLYVHEKFPWALATPDGEEDTPEHDIYEGKAPGWRQASRWGEPGSDEVPEDYLAQVMWYMAIRDREAAHVAALFAGDGLRVYRVPYNAEMAGVLLEAGAKFWKDNVQGGKAPEVDASDAAREYLVSRFPKEVEPLRTANQHEAELLTALLHIRARRKEYESNEELVGNQLRETIGNAAGIEAPGVGRVSWKATKGRTVTDWEALALSLKPAPLLIEQHTKVLPGPRRFVATPEKR